MIPEPLYYECHITIDPVFDERLDLFKVLCRNYHFHVAKLLMVKGGASQKDSFCTGRGNSYEELYSDMMALVKNLQERDFVVRRYKIEIAVLDVRLFFKKETNASTPEMDSF